MGTLALILGLCWVPDLFHLGRVGVLQKESQALWAAFSIHLSYKLSFTYPLCPNHSYGTEDTVVD